MTLQIKNGSSSLLAVSGSLANHADCCCAEDCSACVDIVYADCECATADYTESSQPQIKLDVTGNIVIGGSYACSVPSTQAVSTSFTLSCSASAFLHFWGKTFVRDWQYCTFFVAGTTYRTYTMRATINFSARSTVPGTYNCDVISKAWIGFVQHTGATPPANSCTGSWQDISSVSCPFIGAAPSPQRQEQAGAVEGTFLGNRYEGAECPESCQESVTRDACLTSFGSFTNVTSEADTVHTDNLSYTLSVL